MPNSKLFDQPAGTKFRDLTNNRVYEIIEVDDYHTDLGRGKKRGRDIEYPEDYYLLGSWYPDEVEIIQEGDLNLYEKVAALRPGTIFRVGGGDPWIRTREGVQDIYGYVHGRLEYTNDEIPVGWKTYEIRDITILWAPGGN